MTILDNNRYGKIYGLSDSRTPEFIRYIGFTTKPLENRMKNHRHDSGKNLRTNWIKSIKRAGAQIIITEIDEGHISELPELEKMYIKLFRALGAPLVNGNFGGIGCIGYRWNEEQLSKVRGVDRSKKGGKTYEEVFGVERANEIKSKIGKKSIGRIQKGFGLGRKMSEEWKKKYSLLKMNIYHKKSCIIVQYKNGKKIAQFNSTLEASRKTGLCNSRIKANCRGYVWKHYKKGLTKELVNHVNEFVFKRIPKTKQGKLF